MSANINRERNLERRGNVVVLAAVLMVVLMGMLAFAVDVGHMVLARNEVQNAADSAAMAAAARLAAGADTASQVGKDFAGCNRVRKDYVSDQSVDVEFGTWNIPARAFTSNPSSVNAVRVNVARDANHGGNVGLFFAPIFGKRFHSVNASAVAMSNPRDIVFVVDLSGSMNNDTEPCWATAEIDSQFGGEYPGTAQQLIQNVFDDFGYGPYGTAQERLDHVGNGLVTSDQYAYARMTKDGALSGTPYQVYSSDTEAQRREKAYKWIMVNQFPVALPGVKPTPNVASSSSRSYWYKYLDYIIKPITLPSGSSGAGRPRRGGNTSSVKLPNSPYASYRIDTASNPYSAAYPDADNSQAVAHQNKIGFRTYVQFMMDYGRYETPVSGQHVPLSEDSADCPRHSELTDGGEFLFPPREQPTHAARRAIIAALQVIKERNQPMSDPNQQDWVSIITFDRVSGVSIAQSLTSDYSAAMLACTHLQADSDRVCNTASECGLYQARQHIASPAEGGQGRYFTNKVVVFLTDGIPNLKDPATNVGALVQANPGDYYLTTGDYLQERNAALARAREMQLMKWAVFPVGIGLGTDYDGFMDAAACMGGTANSQGKCPRGSGNPAIYEQRLKEIFQNIITNPRARLVK